MQFLNVLVEVNELVVDLKSQCKQREALGATCHIIFIICKKTDECDFVFYLPVKDRVCSILLELVV